MYGVQQGGGSKSAVFCVRNIWMAPYYKLRDKIVVQILVINIRTCFARSYNVFLADLKLWYNVFS